MYSITFLQLIPLSDRISSCPSQGLYERELHDSPSMYGCSQWRQDLLISEKTNIYILVNLLATFTKVITKIYFTTRRNFQTSECYKLKIILT